MYLYRWFTTLLAEQTTTYKVRNVSWAGKLTASSAGNRYKVLRIKWAPTLMFIWGNMFLRLPSCTVVLSLAKAQNYTVSLVCIIRTIARSRVTFHNKVWFPNDRGRSVKSRAQQKLGTTANGNYMSRPIDGNHMAFTVQTYANLKRKSCNSRKKDQESVYGVILLPVWNCFGGRQTLQLNSAIVRFHFSICRFLYFFY